MTLPEGVGEVLAVIVAGSLAWAALCYREFRNVEERVEDSIATGQVQLARRSGKHLATVMRGGLAPLIDAYFEQRPTEVPVPITADDLKFAAMEMEGSPDLAPLALRQKVTRPLVSSIAGRVLEALPELTPSVALTPEMIDAAFELGANPARFDEDRRQARYTAFRYLGQCISLVAWAGSVLLAIWNGLPPWIPLVFGGAVGIHGFALEVSRHRLERRLHTPLLMSEAADA
jgi:hypothetical protein